MGQDGTDPMTLPQREARLDALELALGLRDAELRYEEQLVAAARQALGERAAALDARQRQLAAAVAARGESDADLGAAAAHGTSLTDIDDDGCVAAAAMLLGGRAALVATREEAYRARAQGIETRQAEVSALRQGLDGAAQRLSAREQQCAAAANRLQIALSHAPAPRPQRHVTPPPVAAAEFRPPRTPSGAELWTPLPVPPPPTSPLPRSAATGLGQLPKITSAVPTPTSGAADGESAARSPTKRLTSTPLFRPAATAPSAAIAAPPPAPEADQETEGAEPADHPDPQPRARVLVDSSPEALARHADTVAVEPDSAEAPSAAARMRNKRRREGPPVRMPTSPSLPIDLPDSVPLPPARNRAFTAPFLATLTLQGVPVLRQGLVFDRVRNAIMVSLPPVGVVLPEQCEMVWRDRDGTQHRFAVALRQTTDSGPSGKLAILSTEGWSEGDYAAMQLVLDRLL